MSYLLMTRKERFGQWLVRARRRAVDWLQRRIDKDNINVWWRLSRDKENLRALHRSELEERVRVAEEYAEYVDAQGAKVTYHVTGGMMSCANYPAESVIARVNDRMHDDIESAMEDEMEALAMECTPDATTREGIKVYIENLEKERDRLR